MSDNELDNLFKEAADEFKVPNDPSAWQNMARKLDQAAVVTSFWNWKSISSLSAVGVTAIAIILYLSVSDSNPEKNAAADSNVKKVTDQENTDSKSAVNDKEVSSSSQTLKDKNDLAAAESDESKSRSEALEAVPGKKESADNKSAERDEVVNSSSQNLKNKNDLAVAESDQNKKNDPGKSSSKALAVETTDKSNPPASIAIGTKSSGLSSENRAERQVSQTKASQEYIQSPKQETSGQNQARVSANSVNENDEVVSANKKREQGALIAEAAVLEKSPDAKNSGSSVMEENSTQSTSNTKAANLQAEKSSVDIDSLKKEEEKKELTTTTLLSKTEEQPEEQKEKSELNNRFAIKLAISPDYSTVKSVSPNSLGINYGVLFEYKLSERWSVATGGIWSKKIYSANDVEYNGYNADWVDGDCRMWDIPVNVYYNFPSRRQFSFYASVGLSSYLMNEENYVYYVESSYGTYDYPMQVKGENNEWFKTLNVSAGMQFRMNKIVSLQFEPTLKAPLAGVGEGEVSLVSLGAFLNLRFDLPIKKPGRNDD